MYAQVALLIPASVEIFSLSEEVKLTLLGNLMFW